MTLGDAVLKHYEAAAEKAKRDADQALENFTPDPLLDQMLARYDEQRDAPGGHLIRFTSASRLEAYRHRRDQALAHQQNNNNDPKDAA